MLVGLFSTHYRNWQQFFLFRITKNLIKIEYGQNILYFLYFSNYFDEITIRLISGNAKKLPLFSNSSDFGKKLSLHFFDDQRNFGKFHKKIFLAPRHAA
jgi:hypothetical protein